MNVVDSSCWLEYFAAGPNAAAFSRPIEDTSRLLVPTIVLLEVCKRFLQQGNEGAAKRAAAHMTQGRVIELDLAIALSAAQIGQELKLPLADSVILATARMHEAVLWTQDAHFQGMEHVKYVPAKGSRR